LTSSHSPSFFRARNEAKSQFGFDVRIFWKHGLAKPCSIIASTIVRIGCALKGIGLLHGIAAASAIQVISSPIPNNTSARTASQIASLTVYRRRRLEPECTLDLPPE
jgi:hypothetical protein